MPSITDKWFQGKAFARQREQDEQAQQRQQRLDQQNQQMFDLKSQSLQQNQQQQLTKSQGKRLWGKVSRLNSLTSQGNFKDALKVAQDIAEVHPSFGGGSTDFINAVANNDFTLAKQMSDNIHTMGIETGNITPARRGDAGFEKRTANAKDWEQFQSLLQKAKETGSPNDAISAEQFGRRSNFIKPTEQEVADIKVTAAEQKEIRKANARRKQGFIDNGVTAADSMANIRRSIDLLQTVETGGIDNVILKAKQLFGVEGSNEAELSANLGKSILAQLKPIFGAAFTASEGARLERIEAKFGSSTEANKRLLNQVFKITERAARRGLAAAENQGADFTANEIREAMAFKLDDKDFSSPSPAQQGQLPQGVTEDDINTTMQVHGMTREQVLNKLGGG